MRLGWFLAFAFLSQTSPAQADITARYSQAAGQGDMIVVTDDRGQSRMNVTDAAYVTTGGVAYIAVTDEQGGYVVRLEDFMSLMDELVRATGPSAPAPGAARVQVQEGGTETVGGHSGRVFRISDPRTPRDVFELVISTDPGLAPLGRAMARPLAPMFATMGRAIPGLAEALSDVLGRGALLRFGPLFRLESLGNAPVPASTFVLPSPPITREALAARLGADRPR